MQRTCRLVALLALLGGFSALASAQAKMYWTDEGTLKIQRANPDGTSVQDLVTSGLTAPQGIALDTAGGKMYWTNSPKVQRANLDGTGVQDLVTGQSDPFGMALDLVNGKMYWVDFSANKIQRANLDGSSVQNLIPSGLNGPLGIALDVAGGKMYWTAFGTHNIQRANLDGSSVQILVTGLMEPQGIALDVASGKMYWTDNQAQKIQRANLDGTSVQNLVTSGLGQPTAIALDVVNGKMYWTDAGTLKVQRANLDGTSVQDLVTSGLGDPVSITLGTLPSGPGPTTTNVVSSVNPSAVGQSVTFTATVTGNSPTSTVQFKDGASNLGAPVTLSAGAASFATASLTAGAHSITGVYSGDPNNLTSTSPVLTQTVGAAPPPPPNQPIPTLSEWMLLLLVGLVGGVAFARLRFRRD